MVRGYQARCAQKSIESKVLDSIAEVPSREYRKRSVLHDGDIPQVTDLGFVSVILPGRHLGVHRCNKPTKFQSTTSFRGEDTLRKNHNAVVGERSSFDKRVHS